VTQALCQRALQLENRRLADRVRQQHGRLNRQAAELRRLEAESPGVTRLKRAPDGGIMLELEDADESFAD